MKDSLSDSVSSGGLRQISLYVEMYLYLFYKTYFLSHQQMLVKMGVVLTEIFSSWYLLKQYLHL